MLKSVKQAMIHAIIASIAAGALIAIPATANAYSSGGHVYQEMVNVNAPGQCLGITGGNMANGTVATLWQCYNSPTTHPDQYWAVTNTVNYRGIQFWFYHNLKNFNKCLDVQSDAQGTPLDIRDCSTSDLAGQAWGQDDDGSWMNYDAFFNAGAQMVIGVKSAATGNGAAIVLWGDELDHPDQTWTFQQ